MRVARDAFGARTASRRGDSASETAARGVTMPRATFVDDETALVDDVRRKRACASAQAVPLCLIGALCAYALWEALMSLARR